MPFDNSDRPRRGRGTGERAINLPPAVMWLIGINVAVQLLRSLLGEATDNVIILMFGLVPAAYTGGDSDLLTQIAAPITYQFLHGGWMHLGHQHGDAGGLRRTGRAHAGRAPLRSLLSVGRHRRRRRADRALSRTRSTR